MWPVDQYDTKEHLQWNMTIYLLGLQKYFLVHHQELIAIILMDLTRNICVDKINTDICKPLTKKITTRYPIIYIIMYSMRLTFMWILVVLRLRNTNIKSICCNNWFILFEENRSQPALMRLHKLISWFSVCIAALRNYNIWTVWICLL